MSGKDISEKTLESYNDVFADIINVVLFDGKQVVKEDELEDATPYSMYKIDDKLHEQQRDCAKYWRKMKFRIALLCFENQTKQDRYMPMRIIGYDGASYRAQLNGTDKHYYPVITLVLYFGYSHWTTSRHLTECFTVDEELKKFVKDYEINVVEVSYLSPEKISLFRSDFKIIADFFVKSRNGHYSPTDDEIKHVDELFKAMSVLTGDKRFDETYSNIVKTKKENIGGNIMCAVLDNMIKEGFEKGEKLGMEKGEKLGMEKGEKLGMEKGEKQGSYKEKTEIAKNLIKLGLSFEQISLATGLTVSQLKELG